MHFMSVVYPTNDLGYRQLFSGWVDCSYTTIRIARIMYIFYIYSCRLTKNEQQNFITMEIIQYIK